MNSNLDFWFLIESIVFYSLVEAPVRNTDPPVFELSGSFADNKFILAKLQFK